MVLISHHSAILNVNDRNCLSIILFEFFEIVFDSELVLHSQNMDFQPIHE